MEPKRLEENFHATLTYNAPTYKAAISLIGGRDPKTGMLKDYVKTAHLIGWPGPSDRKAEQARAEWIVPNMFTYLRHGPEVSGGVRDLGRDRAATRLHVQKHRHNSLPPLSLREGWGRGFVRY